MKRLWAVFTKKRIAHELDDELRTHIDLLAADFQKQGMSPEEARLAARRGMGNLAGMKEEYRDARGSPKLEILLQNIRYAARVLRKNPAFTAVAVFALALGIGANTAVFSMTDVLLLRPLQMANLDRVVNVLATTPGQRPMTAISPGDFADLREQSRTLEHLSVWYDRGDDMTGGIEPQKVASIRVSREFFDALGAQPMMGRLFHAAPDYSGLPHVAVLSFRFWQTAFGGDPGVVGRTVRLSGEPYEIAGVMGKDFKYPPVAQIWIPLALTRDDRARYDAMFLTAVGTLRPGATVEQATAELSVIARGIAQRHPANHERRGAIVKLLNDNISGADVRPIMTMLTSAVGFVLLLAAVNVANLQLARVSLRTREIALRFAVGASRWRIVSQFLTESVVLSLIGAGAGVGLAFWATGMLRPMMPPELWKHIPGWERLGLNGNVLLFAMAVGMAAGILAGVVPALFASRTNLDEALREGGRGASGGARRHRVRNVFVAAQMVLAMVLLVGAVMTVKELRLGIEPAPNLDAAHALTMRVTLPQAKYPDDARRRVFAQQVLERASAIPGVQAVALVRDLPYTDYQDTESMVVAGQAFVRDTIEVEYQAVTPRYFEAMRLPIVAGRAFGEGDSEKGAPAAIVSESFAHRVFGNEDAIGRQIRVAPGETASPWLTIVGIAGNVRNRPGRIDFPNVVYRPMRQAPMSSFCLLLRASDPAGMSAAARAAIHSVDAALPVYEVMILEKVFRVKTSPMRLIASLMSSFGVLALLLSSVGVYSIMAHSVSERRREIGVRVAMGAERRQVVWMFLRHGLWLAGIGMALGLPAAYGLARVLEGLLLGVRASDVGMFALAILVITSSAALASWSAARRAAGIDPVATLREE
jgi:putative ABC transport system permease protein